VVIAADQTRPEPKLRPAYAPHLGKRVHQSDTEGGRSQVDARQRHRPRPTATVRVSRQTANQLITHMGRFEGRRSVTSSSRPCGDYILGTIERIAELRACCIEWDHAGCWQFDHRRMRPLG